LVSDKELVLKTTSADKSKIQEKCSNVNVTETSEEPSIVNCPRYLKSRIYNVQCIPVLGMHWG
jgi:hypothetical protein